MQIIIIRNKTELETFLAMPELKDSGVRWQTGDSIYTPDEEILKILEGGDTIAIVINGRTLSFATSKWRRAKLFHIDELSDVKTLSISHLPDVRISLTSIKELEEAVQMLKPLELYDRECYPLEYRLEGENKTYIKKAIKAYGQVVLRIENGRAILPLQSEEHPTSFPVSLKFFKEHMLERFLSMK